MRRRKVLTQGLDDPPFLCAECLLQEAGSDLDNDMCKRLTGYKVEELMSADFIEGRWSRSVTSVAEYWRVSLVNKKGHLGFAEINGDEDMEPGEEEEGCAETTDRRDESQAQDSGMSIEKSATNVELSEIAGHDLQDTREGPQGGGLPKAGKNRGRAAGAGRTPGTPQSQVTPAEEDGGVSVDQVNTNDARTKSRGSGTHLALSRSVPEARSDFQFRADGIA